MALSNSARKMFDNAWDKVTYIENHNEKSKTSAIVSALEGLALTIAESRVPAVSPGFTLCRRFDENGNYIDEYYPIITAKIDGNIG